MNKYILKGRFQLFAERKNRNAALDNEKAASHYGNTIRLGIINVLYLFIVLTFNCI